MTRMGLSDGVRRALQLAVRAPSGDNCQPWRFETSGDRPDDVSVHWDEERARHPLDVGGRASLLALGALLESAMVAAPLFGLTAEFELLALDEERRAILRFRQDRACRAAPDAAFLSRRFTDRRAYLPGRFDPAWIADWTGGSGGYGGCRAAASHPLTAETQAALAESETVAADVPGGMAQTARWVRFSRSEVESTRDGLPWWTLGVPLPDVLGMRILRHIPSAWRVLRPIAREAIRRQQRRNLRGTSALVGIVGPSTEPRAWVHAGRLGLRLWLRLAAREWSAQPMTASSVFALEGREGPVPVPATAQRALDRSAELLRSKLALQPGESLLWLLRTGPTPGPMELSLRIPPAP